MLGAEERQLRRMGQYTASLPPRRRGEERSKATPSFDFAQDREPVERPFGFAQGHEPVEWQMMP